MEGLKTEIMIKDGIAFFNKSYRTKSFEFDLKHLDCMSIVEEIEDCSSEYETYICYSIDKRFNRNLIELFKREYKGKGYELFRHRSVSEVNTVFGDYYIKS